MSKKKIPKGWTDYLPYGDTVEGTKLFPFKTPLKLEMQSGIPKLQRFTTACLIANRPTLRAVIDLTDTDARADRYYCPKDFIDAKVEHLKLRITGGGLVPGKEKIKLFSDAVDGFLKKFSDDPDALIGVHCTHGLNRTGYFICMYMVTRMGFSPIEAIDSFQKARGYVMYRLNFLEEIKQPGRHTSGSQVADFGEKNNKICSVGNYQYENTWLEDRPNKKPFRGFTEAEIQNEGRNRRRPREDGGKKRWRNSERERNWRERNQPSGIPRDEDMGRVNPSLVRDIPIMDGSSAFNSVQRESGLQYRGKQILPERRRNVRNREDSHLLMEPPPEGRIQTGQRGSHRGGQFQNYRPFPVDHREDFTHKGVESELFIRERAQVSPEEHKRPQIQFNRVQGRGNFDPREHREWTSGGSTRWGGPRDRERRADNFPHQERNETNTRSEMEYRSPLDDDGFEVVSNKRYRSDRGRRPRGRTT